MHNVAASKKFQSNEIRINNRYFVFEKKRNKKTRIKSIQCAIIKMIAAVLLPIMRKSCKCPNKYEYRTNHKKFKTGINHKKKKTQHTIRMTQNIEFFFFFVFLTSGHS